MKRGVDKSKVQQVRHRAAKRWCPLVPCLHTLAVARGGMHLLERPCLHLPAHGCSPCC